ncbi:OLC1v1002705C2 [Oldenlandia corymbosa var. corymbosa]|uniref:OLC1v1002705C2 n=1 Tax=Oldenlandia corymbosa var. corymbosa TaxID=529605 RepID=A0AAV1D8X8_OLDCO|nr:OLC1v1002705C2 [Oldenlandia corymbosa var. corymbosa]
MASVKSLAQSHDLKSLPSDYTHFKNKAKSIEARPEVVNVPVIDLSLLSSTNPDDRAKAIHDLGKACKEWGFFMVINHGIPETLTNPLFETCDEFFDLPEEEKLQFEIKNPRFPVMVRSSVGPNPANEKVLFWRDYLRFFVHPEYYCPHKPEQLSGLVSEYAERTRGLARKLLRGISLSLGLEETYIEKAMEFDLTTQVFAANYYPPCPDPESAIGIPPHTDPGLLTFLLQNGVGGLEIQHEGKWFHLNAIPGSIFVNTGDHLEIVSNGKYKSVWHRAAVNNTKKRISLVVANGPSPDAIVEPAAPLICDDALAKYAPMNYMEYVEVQRFSRLGDKPILDRLKLY